MNTISIKQPNGLIARFSTNQNYFTHSNLTEAEARELLDDEVRRLTLRLDNAIAGQSLVTWEDCLADAWRGESPGSEGGEYLKQVVADATK
jgi:hypothetical protein